MKAKTSIPTQRYSDRGDIGHTHMHACTHAHTHRAHTDTDTQRKGRFGV